MAELGLVGDGPNSYQLWLGGSPNQTRLAEAFQDRVKVQVRGLIRRALIDAPDQTRPLSGAPGRDLPGPRQGAGA